MKIPNFTFLKTFETVCSTKTWYFYIPYHTRVRRLVKILKEKFNIITIFKKTQTLGDILLKKGRQMAKEYKKNITMCRMHQEIHWTNVSYTEEKNC